MTAAYSQQAMRSLLALDRRQRLLAVEAVEALTAQQTAHLAQAEAERAGAAGQDEAEQDAPGLPDKEADSKGQTESAVTEDNDEDSNEDTGQPGAKTTATQTGDNKAQPENATPQADTSATSTSASNGIDMMPFGGNGEMHLVGYGKTGDLVVVIKDTSITVMALIDVMQGLNKGLENHD